MASKKGQSPILQFRNCHILRSHHIIKDDFWVCNGKILNPEKVFFDTKVTADIQIDCDNSIICPGFIDVQINGNYSMFCLLSILYYLILPTTTNACVFKETVIVGAFGVDFSAPDEDINEGLPRVAKGILSHGVTSFCPTVITSPSDVYHKLLPHFYRQPGSPKGAGILGNN